MFSHFESLSCHKKTMETIEHRIEKQFVGRDPNHLREPERYSLDQRNVDGEGWRLVDVLLTGGAPWGFTLRGGQEHHEPLLITKVEEGSKAAAVRLQVGDELVNINDVPLSGYRQEAICLVKGSHKTLTLVVKRKMKMVDIVAQKMPSESDVHVARSFLTKILRSSMRKNRFKGRNEPVSRPHSWHSTKFNEGQSETSKAQSTPSPVWQTRYDASSSSTDLSSGWDQTNLRRVSDQFSSLGSMESLEHAPHPYPPGRLSPGKSNNNSVEHLGGGKRDSAYSSFSTSSGTPDYTLSNSNAASTENMLYKVNQWDSGSRHTNGRHSVGEGVRQDERPGYLQLPSGTGSGEPSRTEEQSGSRHSSSSRTNFGPVWHVPDKRKTSAPSPPPPPPPTRSDSFAVTKVHEKGMVIAYPEAPGAHAQLKSQGKGLDYQGSERGSEARRSYIPSKNDIVSPYISGEAYSQPQLNSNKTYSFSSTDVRVGLPPAYSHTPYHQRQYSDESTLHAQARAVSAPRTKNISGYYSSMQELPTNNHSQIYNQNQGKTPSTSLSSNAIDQNADSGGHSRYYCVTSRQPQSVSQASIAKMEDWKAGSSPEMAQGGGERNSVSAQGGVIKPKYPPTPVLQYNLNSNGQCKQGENQYSAISPASSLEVSKVTLNVEQRSSQRRNSGPVSEPYYMSYPPSKQTEQRRTSGAPAAKEPAQELWQPQGHIKICPQKTPMLHSLSKANSEQDDGAPGSGAEGSKEVVEIVNGKQVRRTDRFATTLRNEIQMKRAQLQKSRSAATLSSTEEAEETPDHSPTSAEGSFTSSYKDHLKEAQARVLKATSFRRRDLEPVLLEHPEPQLPGPPTTTAISRKEGASLPSVSEVLQTKPASAGGQVSRIGSRKRIPADKKVRSFSEPDKIHEVGVDEDPPCPPDSAVSSAGRRKLYEATGKPAFPKPLPKQPQQHASDDRRVTRPGGGMPQPGQTEDVTERKRSGTPLQGSSMEGQDGLSSVQGLENQRLGTFAEYEATWNIQRKPPESKPTGRYHSADNILDPAVEERSKPPCVHERSRSSPSADFYGQNIPVRGRKSAEYAHTESKLSELQRSGTRLSDRGPSELRVKPKPVEPDQFPDLPPPPLPPLPPPPPPAPLENLDSPAWDAPLPPPPSPPPATLLPDPVDPAPPHLHLHPQPYPQTLWKRQVLPRPDRDLEILKKEEEEEEEEEKKKEEEKLELKPEPALPPPPQQPSHGAPALAKPTMEGQRSPSPQFSPQRLTDKPPVSLQDEAPERMERVSEDNSAARKVPIKIVHAESDTEKESRQYLHPHNVAGGGGGVASGTGREAPQAPLGPGATHLTSLSGPEQSYSVFSAYSRQQRDHGPEPRSAADMGAQREPSEPRRDPHKGPQAEHRPSEAPAAPPTDAPHHAPHPSSNGVPAMSISTRLQSAEDEKRDELARDIIDKDKSLADILDQSKMKTTMDLMEGLFPQGDQLLEGALQRRKAAPKQASPRSSEERKAEESTMAGAVALATSSTYYSTSAPKAELLIKMKDMQQESEEQEDSEEELDHELANKKQELIDSLSRKLQVLREARESLQEDVEENNALGQEVEVTVQQVCKPNELDKFRMFVGDLDKVVSLLLSLSGRLARVENALNSLEEDASPEERRILTDKRKLLIRQHEDAKELKENLDRRERVVYDILASYLDEESLADYEHFVKMKSALIIEQRKLEDKIKLGDEQLKCLMDSLPLDQRLPI
ncbi:protein Shroom2 isoform X3 [Alosa alosa]|uniref:protein Shroom2 isoform X3 n=1 Tax=Alosa alosa TaxID=278164 RepID=UPI0020151CFC|nr:protein Shroom2 isoform X3 [Alosa alosa]